MSYTSKRIEEEIYERVFFDLRSSPETPDRSTIQDFVDMHVRPIKAKIKREIGDEEETEIEIDEDRIVEKLSRNLVIHTDEFSIINIADDQHIDWLSQRREDIENGKHWQAYKRYQSSKLSKDQIRELDNSTDKILASIEDPLRKGAWNSKGLVIGDVQSGKTTNYLGVVSKALDAGYKIIIILSGLHNNLRVQTQERFEEGITGHNTTDGIRSNQCGVARYVSNFQELRIEHLTSRDDQGDFKKVRRPGGILEKTYSINKKNKNTLENLIEFINRYIEDGKKIIYNSPLLLIDDEADNATINTSRDEDSPSTINKLIKKLLSLFQKSAYIGYTATPFANVLINPFDKEDLFPRNFIMCLGSPNNYIGPKQVFGEVEDDFEGNDQVTDVNESNTDMDWFRNVDEYVTDDDPDWIRFIPDRHKKDHEVETLPRSLKDAILNFLIAVTIRNLRSDNKEHKTMLIHVTRYKKVQGKIVDLVEEFVDEIYSFFAMRQLEQNVESNILSDLERIYFSDFSYIGFEWKKIKNNLKNSSSAIRNHVFGINGDFKDLIDEDKYPNGLVSIRIGGDKLSRGLTLPGLMTSYFLRVSRMYDTLMQMGRWFGYRDNYDDLCRIFTTGKLYNWYAHIALASEDLKRRIKRMNNQTLTPLEYQQQIQSHPGMLMVTALNKQRHSRKVRITFNESYAQQSGFDLSDIGKNLQNENKNNILSFLKRIKNNNNYLLEKNHHVFRNVKSEEIIKFVDEYHYNENNVGIWNKESINKYIKEMNKLNELVNWTVILFSSSGKGQAINLEDYSFKVLQRKSTFVDDGILKLQNSALMSASDQKLDLTESEVELALSNATKKVTAQDYRSARNPEKGLLIIYFIDVYEKRDKSSNYSSLKNYTFPALGMSFPKTENKKTVEVVVNYIDDFEDDFEDEFEDE